MTCTLVITIIVLLILVLTTLLFSRKIVDTFTSLDVWHKKIPGIVYINLEKREDRKKLILNELEKIETDMSKVNKVSGIYTPKNGHKGCVQSHILALNIAKMNKWDLVLIFEDDIELLVTPDIFNDTVNKALDYLNLNSKDWDVLMLATAYASKTRVNDTISKVKNATTGSAYIVNKKYYDTILDLFNNCNDKMSREEWGGGKDWEPNALDQRWLDLQNKDNWYCFNNDLIKQRNIISTTMTRE